jgi:hypothetical protein
VAAASGEEGVSLLDDATLEGGLVRVQLGDAIAQASENLSIDGAPTVRMTLLDPARELLGSQLWQQRSRLALGERRYVLVQTDKQAGGLLQLTFEQWESYVLRQARGYGQKADTARRKTITRVAFAERLCRASRVKFHAPEAGPPVPKFQGAGATTASAGTTQAETGSGFSAAAKKKIKIGRDGGAPLTRVQEEALTVALGEAVRLKATVLEMTGMVMAGIMESNWDPKVQESKGSAHWGLFQQNTTAYTRPDAGDPLQAAHEFLCGSGTWQELPWKARTDKPTGGHSFLALMKGFTGAKRTLGSVVEEAQGSGTGKGGGAYDAFRVQANAVVAGYHNPGWTDPHRTLLLSDQYAFSRGEAGKPETTWDCLGRLAEEIGWRRFLVGDTVWFVSDEWLMATPPRATLAEGDGVVDGISWTLDVGKARDECQVQVNESWLYAPGVLVTLEGEGPADGKWIVAEWERDLLQPSGTLRLVKPGGTLPEPVGDQTPKGFKPTYTTTTAAQTTPKDVRTFSGGLAKEVVMQQLKAGNITTDGSVERRDLERGSGTTLAGDGPPQDANVDPRLYSLLAWLVEQYEIVNVSSVISDHNTNVHNSHPPRPSNHSAGRGMDLNRIAKRQVEDNKDFAVTVMVTISKCPKEFRPTEIGGPRLPVLPDGGVTFSGGHFFTDGDHQNHVHVGFSS